MRCVDIGAELERALREVDGAGQTKLTGGGLVGALESGHIGIYIATDVWERDAQGALARELATDGTALAAYDGESLALEDVDGVVEVGHGGGGVLVEDADGAVARDLNLGRGGAERGVPGAHGQGAGYEARASAPGVGSPVGDVELACSLLHEHTIALDLAFE